MNQFKNRLSALQKSTPENACIVISRAADIRYFSGFICLTPEEREAFLVVNETRVLLLYPSFSPVEKIPQIEYQPGYWPEDLQKAVKQLHEQEKVSQCLIDSSSLFVNEYKAILAIKELEVDELPLKNIWQLRMKKDQSEVKTLKLAARITNQVMKIVHDSLRIGVSEQELAGLVEIEVRKLGASGTSFPPVIAFGPNAALPHHQPTDLKLKKETAVLVDIGALVDGYCGDMTRTWWFGDNPSNEFREIKQVVEKAYAAAVKSVLAGVSVAEVDQAARGVITKAGYGDKYIHTTGHGVGLEIHEHPSLYFKHQGDLPAGAVVTIEPGIYLPGEVGYRFENTVVVTDKGCEVITE